MRRFATIALVSVLLAFTSTARCEHNAFDVRLEIPEAAVTRDGVLHCKWKIRNSSKALIHVYTTYLHGSSDDMLDLHQDHAALVRTTWLHEIKSYPAYYVPKPEFVDVAPGTEITGSLERRLNRKKEAHLRKVQLVVGYGSDIQQLNHDLSASLAAGTEFQGNAIVRWQRLSYSPPVEVARP